MYDCGFGGKVFLGGVKKVSCHVGKTRFGGEGTIDLFDSDGAGHATRLMVVVVVVTEGLLLLGVFTVSTGANMAFIFVETDEAGLGGGLDPSFPSSA